MADELHNSLYSRINLNGNSPKKLNRGSPRRRGELLRIKKSVPPVKEVVQVDPRSPHRLLRKRSEAITDTSPETEISTTVGDTVKPIKVNQIASPVVIQSKKKAIEISSAINIAPKQIIPTFFESLELRPDQVHQLITGSFLYLALRTENSTVYDLVVVQDPQEAKKGNVYFTVSKDGLSKFCVGEEVVFTKLETWEKEFSRFHRLQRINLFSVYRRWKTFAVWKKMITKRKTAEASAQLVKGLFIFDKKLQTPLLQLFNFCLDASQLNIIDCDPRQTYSLKTFNSAQQARQETVKRNIKNLVKQLTDLIRSACDDVLDIFIRKNKIGDDQKLTFMERASLRNECNKLVRFIRLADFVMLDTVRNIAFQSVDFLLKSVKPEIKRARKILLQIAEEDEQKIIIESAKAVASEPECMLKVEVGFEDTGAVKLTPSCHDIIEVFNDTIEEAVKCISLKMTLKSQPELAPYIAAADVDSADSQQEEFAMNPIDTAQLLLEDDRMTSRINQIISATEDSFAEVIAYSEDFRPYFSIYSENKETQSNAVELFSEYPVNKFRELIEKFEGQGQKFVAIPVLSEIGIISLDSSELKRRLLPSPDKCLEALKCLIPDIFIKLSNVLLDDLSNVNPKLASTNETVADYVAKCDLLLETNKRAPELKTIEERCKDLVTLMQENEWTLSQEVKTGSIMLADAFSSLDRNCQMVETESEDEKARFTKKLIVTSKELRKDVNAMSAVLEDEMLRDETKASNEDSIKEVCAFLDRQKSTFNTYKDKVEKIQTYQQALGEVVQDFEELETVEYDLGLKSSLWTGVEGWNKQKKKWLSMEFGAVNAEAMSNIVAKHFKTAATASRVLSQNPVCEKYMVMVDEFKQLLPVIESLTNKTLKVRHWKKIEELAGFPIQGDDSITLGYLIEKGVNAHAEEIQTISTTAMQESVLEELFQNKVVNVWNTTSFTVLPFKESKDVFILGGVDEIIAALDDGLVTINTILSSRYCGNIRVAVTNLNKDLILVQETLDEWLQCQKAWMYLESIFSAPDIQRQLPEEAKLFDNIDKGWKAIMRDTEEIPQCLKAAGVSGRKEKLRLYNNQLDKIQKSLEDYLETKRQAFGRFYFISNDELLAILSKARDPTAVQPFLRKCFDALVKLEFGTGNKKTDILKMISGENERVPLTRNLKARGPVEEWLGNVETAMKKSLRRCMKEGCLDYDERPRTQWIKMHPGQVVMTVAQIMWSRRCEQVIMDAKDDPKAWNEWYKENCGMVSALTGVVRQKISKIERRVVVALVTTDVHARDIVEEMGGLHDFAQLEPVQALSNFTWQKQLRYYWDTEIDNCIVRQSNAKFIYGYEYMGCTTRLVITPLTDRCWMTITGSIHLKLGASPAGPAGTGKTESTKDLAKAMGMFCVVFNCSDQIDYLMMAKLFAGLAATGNWTCLDEFNRIVIEVLSVIAQQLFTLRAARQKATGPDDAPMCHFEGRYIKVNVFSVNVTMNPGYAGRTALPDNLKVFFRPVAMMIPDYALIAEIMLFAEGFEESRGLSKKMIKMYKLASEQLSQQRHYDYGLRAVKSVLVMAGGLKRENPDLTEEIVLIRALRDSNLPKFLQKDVELFLAILGDLFPGVDIPFNDYGELQDAIEYMGLQKVPDFIAKTIQLYETFNVRFGVTICGPTTGGKSRSYQVLQRAMTRLFEHGSEIDGLERVFTHIINPKSITMGELYGEFNELTSEWTDGLGSTIIRGLAMLEDEQKNWVVFDGPVDTLWIESLNTVLDDNMTLCLANGERIKLRPQMKMLFECADLAVASPATVSRVGVVYYAEEVVGWLAPVQTWLAYTFPEGGEANMEKQIMGGIPAALYARIEELFEITIEDALYFQRRNCDEPVKTINVALILALSKIFTSMWKSAVNAGQLSMSAPEAQLIKIVDHFFGFAFVWTFGASASSLTKEKIDTYVCDKIDVLANLSWVRTGTCFDCYPVIEGDGSVKMRPWSTIMPEFTYDRNAPFFDLVVPTADTVKHAYLMQKNLEVKQHTFFTGLTGTGKTVIVNDVIKRLSKSEEENGMNIMSINLNFSAQTKALDTQLSIVDKLEKKRKTLLGPPGTKKLGVVFVDDVNMPEVEEYGAMPPIELMRQFTAYQGVYDRQKLFWVDVQNMITVLAAAPPGGGRAEITPRFKKLFHVMCVSDASNEVLNTIFSAIFTSFLGAYKIVQEAADLGKNIVKSTIIIYESIAETLKPTPAKSHYTFNLRDISKVFQGIMMIRSKQVKDASVMAKLWLHECCRVFHDRLVNKTDKRWFTDEITKLLNKKLGINWTHESIFEGNDPLVFCDFLKPGVSTYDLVKNTAQISKVLYEMLDDYNLTNPTKMNLVFFRSAIEHVTRVSRIIRQPRGNAMLVGVGGSGKQSLTRMACHMSETKCFQIELVRGYGTAEFREDIKALMIEAGVEGKQVCFLFIDTQIVNETFVEDINNVLNTGEITGLFANDEINKICEDLRPLANSKNIVGSKENLWQLFVSRERDNLHIVLGMSPVGDTLRVRCRQFPSLINCTTIDWYDKWPRDALLDVAKQFLAEEDLGDEENNARVTEMAAEVPITTNVLGEKFFQELRRIVYSTPKSYLDMIALYTKMLGERREMLGQNLRRMSEGVRKIEETRGIVDGLQAELTELQPILKVKAEETAELLIVVAREQKDAEKVATVVGAEEKVVGAQADEVRAVQADAQADLDKAMPALRSAVKALDALDKKDITEIKSFAKPPPAVMVVMEAVCLLLGEATDWDTAKKVMGKSDFLPSLVNYDKDHIKKKILKKLKKYTKNPIMQVEVVQKVSKAATSLCMWVHAMDVYSVVAKEVGPKKAKLEAMNVKLNAALSKLAVKQASLKEVLDQVDNLKAQLQEAMDEKERLLKQSALTEARLVRANQLTSLLADEYVRWKESVGTIQNNITNLTGDVFLAAALISYIGPFTGKYREEIILTWTAKMKELNIPCSETPSLFETVGDPVQVRQWQIDQLPTDTVSTDNAIMFVRGDRWPLLIDPQEQGKRWIKNTFARQNLDVTRMNDTNILRTLENGIRVGRPLLIEDIGESLSPALEPILQKATFKQSGRLLIRIGDSDVDYDPNFKFFLTTKLPNPHYLPEVCIKVTLINFTVTFEGLTDQLLGTVVQEERPDVQVKKNELLVTMANDQKTLSDLEAKILKMLAESEGNILDDVELIQTLKESKEISTVIKARLLETMKTNEEIELLRDQYRPVPVRGSILYFVIAGLVTIDPMYQYSLAFFVKLYLVALRKSEKSNDITKRLDFVIDYLMKFVYSNVCRGLFSQHELLFSFLSCCNICQKAGIVSSIEYLTFLRGAGMSVNPDPNPLKGFLKPSGWNLCHVLNDLEGDAFEGLKDHICNNSSEWREWAESKEPQEEMLPGDWSKKLSRFCQILLIKAFRDEKVLFACKNFVKNQESLDGETKLMGEEFTLSPPATMADVFADATPAIPIIFILSTGADPTDMMDAFAKKMNMTDNYRVVALGQGQGPRAEEAIAEASKRGGWVMLQNLHLGKSWLPKMEEIVVGFEKRTNLHQDFRLFLSSMPAAYFPVPVLQNGIKLTTEPPKGIRANLLRSCENMITWTDMDDMEDRSLVPWFKLAFGSMFFHATVQERRTFGALGFNIPYEFNDTDLAATITILRMFLTENDVVPYQAITYVTGQISYGGRVTDDWDRRCVMTILAKFINSVVVHDDNYVFSKSGKYYCPPTPKQDGKLDILKRYVEQLPSMDEPSLFGLHANAKITVQQKDTKILMDCCVSMAPRTGGSGGGKSNDEIVDDLAKVIESKLPGDFLMDNAGPTTFTYKGGNMDSLGTLLSQEMIRYNHLLSVMRDTLANLQLAIIGETLMSSVLDQVFFSLLNNVVPPACTFFIPNEFHFFFHMKFCT